MPTRKKKKKSKLSKLSKFDPTPRHKKRVFRSMHHSYLKKVILTDINRPNGVKENPFLVKNRSISNRVNSIIIGIQQPIVKMLGLTADTWYKQYCDPVTKTIFLEIYEKDKTNELGEMENGN